MEKQVTGNLEYLSDDVYYTGQGFDLVAGVIAEEILRNQKFNNLVVK